MGQALYRQYRSKNLAEIVGQEHITKTLSNTLKRGAIGHAYLLTGPRGVGKTSIARILAHEINELPYEQEKVHLDIIEIDAASNRRIDEIRDLRDKVHIAPSSAKYKVYIIDEVHMLTKEAFNALLKTLEEPPKHVIFILATTDVHKLPETIISRTQHFTFKPIAVAKIIEHLKAIAKSEKISIDEEAIEVIAKHSNGSFRDSIGLLEQASGLSDKVSVAQVQNMLGVPPVDLITDLLEAFMSGDTKTVIDKLQNLYTQGFLAEEISVQINEQLRNMIIENKTDEFNNMSQLMSALINVPASRDPEALLEIELIKHINIRTKPSATKVATLTAPVKINHNTLRTSNEEENAAVKKSAETKEQGSSGVEKKLEPTKKPEMISAGTLDNEVWELILNELRTTYSTLYSIARMADFSTDGTNILLRFNFPFHKKRMETDKHKQILNELFSKKAGLKPVIQFDLMQKKQKKGPHNKVQEAQDNPVEAISNIFGGAEVLES